MVTRSPPSPSSWLSGPEVRLFAIVGEIGRIEGLHAVMVDSEGELMRDTSYGVARLPAAQSPACIMMEHLQSEEDHGFLFRIIEARVLQARHARVVQVWPLDLLAIAETTKNHTHCPSSDWGLRLGVAANMRGVALCLCGGQQQQHSDKMVLAPTTSYTLEPFC